MTDLLGESKLASEYRAAMGQLAGGVCIAMTVDPAGDPHGTTVTTGFSVSMNPPLFSISLAEESRSRQLIEARGSFMINILHGDAVEVARTFASDADRFAGLAPNWSASGLPWLPDHSVRAVECQVDQVVPAGDHVLIIGRVIMVHRPEQPARHGLGYLDRSFHRLPHRP